MKKKCGSLESFSGPSDHDSNSMKGVTESSQHYFQDMPASDSDYDDDYGNFMEILYNFKDDEDPDEALDKAFNKIRQRDYSYEMFLGNIQDNEVEGFTVNIQSDSGSRVITYEGKEEDVEKGNLKSTSKRVKAKVPEISSGLRKEKTWTPKPVKEPLQIGNVVNKNKSKGVGSEKRNRPVHENEVVEDKPETYSVPCKPSGEPEINSVPYRQCGEPSAKKMDVDMRDESSVQLLDISDESNNSIEPSNVYDTDRTSKHQKNNGGSSDLEILENIHCHGANTPFVPSRCYQSLPGEESWGPTAISSQSQFRDRLMNLLTKPYNQEELENLWREVTQRKPVERVKDLRNGRMKSYQTNDKGKSYLDWYQELKNKVDEFRSDRCKILYLLRGFFFWLENTAHADAFQPWTDSLFLNALG